MLTEQLLFASHGGRELVTLSVVKKEHAEKEEMHQFSGHRGRCWADASKGKDDLRSL